MNQKLIRIKFTIFLVYGTFGCKQSSPSSSEILEVNTPQSAQVAPTCSLTDKDISTEFKRLGGYPNLEVTWIKRDLPSYQSVRQEHWGKYYVVTLNRLIDAAYGLAQTRCGRIKYNVIAYHANAIKATSGLVNQLFSGRVENDLYVHIFRSGTFTYDGPSGMNSWQYVDENATRYGNTVTFKDLNDPK